MRAGVGVVASAAGGNPETIRDGESGLLVKYNDESALIAAISRLLKDQILRERMIVAARDDLKKFNWPNLVKSYSEALKISKL